MKLVLIRHGQTDSNLSGALDTAFPGCPLNETGLQQAKEIPEKYRRLVATPPSRIHASFIQRAFQTAKPLAKAYGLEIVEDPDLREILAGDLEMSTTPEDTLTYLQVAIGWATGEHLDRAMPGGQTGKETLKRFDQAIARLTAGLPAQATVVAFIHGAIMRVWGANRIRGISLDLLAQFPCQNGSLTVAEGDPASGWDLQYWSDHSRDFWPVVPGGLPRTSKEAQEVIEKILLS